MQSNQQEYIAYARKFAEDRKCHLWLGGSFLHGTSTPYSDVDLSALCGKEELRDLIYGYSEPVLLSSTTNPPGILIVIYKDGVAVDLEVLEQVEGYSSEPGTSFSSEERSECFFHLDRIKDKKYERNESICQGFALREDEPYQMSRLFHRSLIKYLCGKSAVGSGDSAIGSGKITVGISVANEIAEYMSSGTIACEDNYPQVIRSLWKDFRNQYPLPHAYCKIIDELLAIL
ncbi:MAG: hypothetical protein J5379_07775 [Clostridiales bacterium]|nr:hypothetical protein [Clostridiales bacterium]